MGEGDKQKHHREAIAKQYRDWLVPATLFVGVAAGVLMLAVQLTDTSTTLLVAAALSFTSILFFVVSLFWAVTRLESIEVFEKKPHEPGQMFALSCGGVATLLASLTVFCFVKATSLGVASLIIIAFAVVALVLLLRHEEKME